MTLPDGYVDPTDEAQVRDVIAAVFASDGASGVFDLLGRLPAAARSEGSPARFLKRAEPPMISLGIEHRFVLTDGVLMHSHLVRGVVLQTDPIGGGQLATALSPIITRFVADDGRLSDASAALTAVRDVTDPP